MIHDALYPVSWDAGRGYYFVLSASGMAEIYSGKPDLESKDISDLQDGSGKYIVKEFFDIITKDKEGYSIYSWYKPDDQSKMYPKVSFVKLFEPI